MKWLLVVFLVNAPVKTDLVFDSLDSCLAAETKMRTEWAAVYNRALASNMSAESLEIVKSQMPRGSCIPSK